MKTINQIASADNRARRDRRVHRDQPHRRRPRRNPGIQASIAVSRHGDSFGVASIIYRAGQPLKRDFVLLKPGE